VGSTNRRADADMIQELRRVERGESFDEQPMPDLDSEALDFRAASESFASVRALTRHDFATLHLVANHQGRRVPTIGGVLLFGLDRAAHFPDAWIQAGRFAGVDKARIVDHAELRELPVHAIEHAIQFIEKHSTHGAEIGRNRRKERWNGPAATPPHMLVTVATMSPARRALLGARMGRGESARRREAAAQDAVRDEGGPGHQALNRDQRRRQVGHLTNWHHGALNDILSAPNTRI
jgi:hypothetical protein